MIAGGRAGQDTRALGVVVELEVEEAERSTTVSVVVYIQRSAQQHRPLEDRFLFDMWLDLHTLLLPDEDQWT